MSALVGFTTACGDDDGDDGGAVDAGADTDGGGDPDASTGPSFNGTILFGDFSLVDLPQAGEGPLIQIAFRSSEDLVAPSYEQQPGSPFGCKVFELTAAQYASIGLDEGTVQITAEGGPEFPPCNFVEGRGYVCIGTTGSGGAIAAVDAANGIYSWTDPDTTFTDAEVGRYLELSGATNAANNGRFPIVAQGGPNTLIYRNVQAVVEADSPASFQTVAGLGPAGQTDTLPNDQLVTVEITSGGEGHIESATGTFSAPTGIGDDFTLDEESLATITDIPLDGSAFTLSCGGTGGECGTATVTAINIFTTDAPVPPAPVPEVVFPNPEEFSVQIQCISIMTDQITVTPEAAAFLNNPDITRARTSFVRAQNVALMNQGDPDATVSITAGHITTGFTTAQ